MEELSKMSLKDLNKRLKSLKEDMKKSFDYPSQCRQNNQIDEIITELTRRLSDD